MPWGYSLIETNHWRKMNNRNIQDEFQNLKPYDMSLYLDSSVSGKQQNYIDVQYYFDKIFSGFKPVAMNENNLNTMLDLLISWGTALKAIRK